MSYGPVAATRRMVDGTMQVLARAAPLVWSVLGDGASQDGYRRNAELRRLGYPELVAVLAEKHPMRPGLTARRARDVLLVLTGAQLYWQCTRDLNWPPPNWPTG